MSHETVILLVAGYVGVLTLVMCLLMMAKRGDEAATAWQAGERGADDGPSHRDAA